MDSSVERSSTLENMTLAEKERVTSPGALVRVERFVHATPREVFFGSTDNILDKRMASIWPLCAVHILWFEQSLWEVVVAAWDIEELYKEKKAKGDVEREITFVSFPGFNHFVSFYIH
jgi:hypothetical protein